MEHINDLDEKQDLQGYLELKNIGDSLWTSIEVGGFQGIPLGGWPASYSGGTSR